MEKKWTEGPWYAIKHPTFDGAKYRVCSSRDEPWANYGEICYARKANAHLIAAAPELYEALLLVDNVKELPIRDRDIIKAALAKARDEQ